MTAGAPALHLWTPQPPGPGHSRADMNQGAVGALPSPRQAFSKPTGAAAAWAEGTGACNEEGTV